MATKSEPKTAAETTSSKIEALTAQAKDTTKAFSDLFLAFAHGGRAAFDGVVAVDKAVLGYASDAAKSYYEFGRKTIEAKSIDSLLDLNVAFAHDRIDATAANSREVVDLVQSKASAAYAPIKDALEPYMPAKKNAA